MRRSRQMSESIELGIVLALAGGFMDAYSYMCRDEVFANAQTGNMLLLGINLSERNWGMALRYLFPVLAFAIGIALADVVRMHAKDKSLFHWRQLSVLCEALVLFVVCFFPQSMNLAANSLTSLACGIQVESFRKIHGNGIATTMCIGNLRSGTAALSVYLREKKPEQIRQSMHYFAIIFIFAVGAGIGGNLSAHFGIHMIWFSCGLLLISFLMMFRR